MHRILIPLLTLAVFLWLCWHAWPYHSYDVEGMNELTGRLAVTHAKPLTVRVHGLNTTAKRVQKRAEFEQISSLWNITEAQLNEPVNLFGE